MSEILIRAKGTCLQFPLDLPLGQEGLTPYKGHRGAVVWFTGLSGAGKSTLAMATERQLNGAGCQTILLDGDRLRSGLCADLDYSPAARHENLRRAGELVALLVEAGFLVLAAFISPYRADRQRLRERLPTGAFVEIHCNCPLSVCEQRDVKGLYRLARRGDIPNFTGVSAPYEPPRDPELTIDTAATPTEAGVQAVIMQLVGRRILY
jgi:adenylylsulfate kinase